MATKTATQRTSSTSANNVKPAPVHKISLSPVHITIWKNSSNQGEFYSVRVERAYKKDGEFDRTNSFGEKHLPLLEIALKEARAWIEDHKL